MPVGVRKGGACGVAQEDDEVGDEAADTQLLTLDVFLVLEAYRYSGEVGGIQTKESVDVFSCNAQWAVNEWAIRDPQSPPHLSPTWTRKWQSLTSLLHLKGVVVDGSSFLPFLLTPVSARCNHVTGLYTAATHHCITHMHGI